MSTNLALGIATGVAISAAANSQSYGPMPEGAGKAIAMYFLFVVLATFTGWAGGKVRRFFYLRKNPGAAWYRGPDAVNGLLAGGMIGLLLPMIVAAVIAVLS